MGIYQLTIHSCSVSNICDISGFSSFVSIQARTDRVLPRFKTRPKQEEFLRQSSSVTDRAKVSQRLHLHLQLASIEKQRVTRAQMQLALGAVDTPWNLSESFPL